MELPNLWRLKLICALLVFQICVAAAMGTVKPLKYYAVSTWKTDQGLPQDFITDIAQTQDGFLWVGTMSGLVRFDGLRFVGVPLHEDKGGLQERVSALTVDRQGSLWIGTSNGLVHYDNGKVVPVTNQSGSNRFVVEQVIPDQVRGVWFTSHGRLFDARGKVVTPCALPVDGRPGGLRTIAEKPDGTLWVGGNDGVYMLRDCKLSAHYTKNEGLPASPVSLLYADCFGNLYAGDGHHLFRFNGRRFAPVAAPGLGNFVSLLTDHAGNLWMASGGLHGISRNVQGKVDLFTSKEGLASDDARVLFEDHSHDLWIGTIAGLQRLHDGTFTTYTESDGLPHSQNQYDAVFEDKNNDIWVGSLEDGVARLHEGKFESFSVRQGLKRGQVRGFADTEEGLVVAVSDYGLFRLRGKHFVRIPGIPHGYITSPVSDGAGALWFAVNGNGVFRLFHHAVTHYTTSEGLPSLQVLSLLPDQQGGILAATSEGIAELRDDRFERIGSMSAISMSKDGNSALWLGTNDGLVHLQNGSAVRLTQEHGLPSNLVLATTPDNAGNLWIATANAIGRLDRGQLEKVMAGKEREFWPRHFTQEDGLRSRNVLPSGQVSMCRAHDGRIWFATANGLSVADPGLKPAPAAHVVIESIAIDESQQPVASDIVVPPGRHRLTFTYTAPDLHSPEQLRFRYRLKGWDQAWLDAGIAREASYTALPPGNYQLEIVAANEDGVWSATSTSVGIRVRPFFYQTKLFLFLAFLACIALVIEITRRRTSRVAERQRLRFQERAAERERIAYQIHDTIIQDMVGTALQLEVIGMRIPERPESASTLLEGLTARMRETVSKSRVMVSSLHSTATPEYDLLEVLSNAGVEFRLCEKPRLIVKTEGAPREIDPWIRDEVYRICREAIANGFRHANAETIEVRVSFAEGRIVIAIQDDGVGMDEQTRAHGRSGHFGLRGMQIHAGRIDALLAIRSEPQRGTCVTLTVPTKSGRWWHSIQSRIVMRKNDSPTER